MLCSSASNIATSAIPGRYEKPSRGLFLPDCLLILHGLPPRHFHLPPLPAHVYQSSQNNRLQLAQARPLDDYHLPSNTTTWRPLLLGKFSLHRCVPDGVTCGYCLMRNFACIASTSDIKVSTSVHVLCLIFSEVIYIYQAN